MADPLVQDRLDQFLLDPVVSLYVAEFHRVCCPANVRFLWKNEGVEIKGSNPNHSLDHCKKISGKRTSEMKGFPDG